MLKKLAVSILAAAFSILLCSSCGGSATKETPLEQTGFVMGSFVEQTIYPKGDLAQEAAKEVTTRLTKMEQLISWRIQDSDIAKINQNAGGQEVAIDALTFTLLQTAKGVAINSGGAYNPAILPLSMLWNVDDEAFIPPERQLVEGLLASIDSGKLVLDEEKQTAVMTLEGGAIDLGGIGKGAACDEALKIYQEKNIPGAIIAVGGSVGVHGTKANGKPWSIGVRDPKKSQDTALGQILLEKGCVSTSGIYEKGQEIDGVYYHHIIDSATGFPADSDLVSATVVHDSGAISDALATACIVLGREGALPLLEQYGAGAVLIDQNNTIYLVGDMKSSFELASGDYHIAQ